MNTNSTALVVHDDNKKEVSSSSSTSGIVLDALPYVEALDPNYEQYAISLIEEELHHVASEQQQKGNIGQDGDLGDHPTMRRLLTASAKLGSRGGSSSDDIAAQMPDFCGKAPMAAAAYASLVAQRANGNETTDTPTGLFLISRPDPMAEDGAEEITDEQTLLSNLQTSISTSKIQLEQERLRYINLELHQQFETPARYTAYTTQLEDSYLNPTSNSVENQRRSVDGINATRMEEQQIAGVKMEGLKHKWNVLVDKNRRLGLALTGLEQEVEGLRGGGGLRW